MSSKRNRIANLYKSPMIPTVCQSEGVKDLVSVLIPTFNRGYILGSALDSVFEQDYRPIEVIVVDDGSTDNTTEILEKYLLKYPQELKVIKQKNQGLAAARNTGLAAAIGEFIALQDSDDLWLKTKLSNQIAVMKKNPDLAICWTQIHTMNDQGKITKEYSIADSYHVYKTFDLDKHFPLQPAIEVNGKAVLYRKTDIMPLMFLGNLVHPPVALIRRTAIAKAGGLDLTYAWTCEDYEFFWRICEHGLGAFIEEPGMLYRVGANDQLTQPELMLFVALGNLKSLVDKKNKFKDAFNYFDKTKTHFIDGILWAARSEMASPDGYFLESLKYWLSAAQKNIFLAMKDLPQLARCFILKYLKI